MVASLLPHAGCFLAGFSAGGMFALFLMATA
jgi:hypothetical protein